MLKFGGKTKILGKMWSKSKIFQAVQNFTKIPKYAKNDEIPTFAKLKFKMTPGSTKMVTTILACDTPKWGFHKNGEFSFSWTFPQ